jgi:hypothetical protein
MLIVNYILNSETKHRKAHRISHDDIRNMYAKSLESVLNSSDPEYVTQAFHSLLDTDSLFESFLLEQNENGATVEVPDQTAQGIDEIAAKFIGCVVSVPDSIFLIHEWQIFPRPNNSCCLVCKFSFTGSKAFDFSTPCILGEATNDDNADGNTLMEAEETERVHSIQFKQHCKTIKYENRKKGKKIFTIGEYVHANEMTAGHLTSLHDTDKPDTTMFVSANNRWKAVKSETVPMNSFGILRFYIHGPTGNYQIFRIHCLVRRSIAGLE